MFINSNKLYFLFFVLFFASCNNKKNTDLFGKKEMFSNYADNLIIPSYKEYGIALNNLKTAFDDFNANTTISNLEALQTAFLNTYQAWQNCEIYDKTAPADAIMSLENSNYYPCNADSIEAYITRNDNSVAAVQNKKKYFKGLAAAEYLLFSRTLTQQQILDRYTISSNSTSYKTYLASIIINLKTIQVKISDDWINYKNIFVENISTDASSAFSTMVNSIAQRTDDLKRMQVGTPAGYQGNVATATVKPKDVQAYYSNHSIEYMLLTLENMKDVLNGKGAIDGKGLIDYIRTLGYYSTLGGNLADDILSQIEICKTKVNACAPDYSETIVNNKSKADALFLETKKLLVLIKVDLPSSLGVSINYTDSDGD